MSNAYLTDAPRGALDTPRSAVAWPAIFAGSLAGAAVGIILLMFGAGIGLSAISPWGGGASAAAFGVGAAIWLIVIEWGSAAFAGYFAGRLRTRWSGIHTDEVFFRDTAHGFIAWSFSLVVLTVIVGSGVVGLLGAGAAGVTAVASSATQGVAQGATSAVPQVLDANGYLSDLLFRRASTSGTSSPAAAAPAPSTEAAPSTAEPSATTPPPADGTVAPPASMAETPGPAAPAVSGPAEDTFAASSDTRAEGTRILLQSVAAGEIAPDDRTYLAGLIAEQTGLSQADAEARVNNVLAQANAVATKAKEAADAARSAAAKASLYGAISLLIGAFIACVAAALGGKQRDEDELKPVA